MSKLAISEVRLDQVTLYGQQAVSDHLAEHMRFDAAERDAMTRSTITRGIFRAFGRTERAELSCPETWWQHLKMALRQRWPRLFGWMRVRMLTARIDSGAVVAGLRATGDRQAVIPYVTPLALSRWTDGLPDEGDQ